MSSQYHEYFTFDGVKSCDYGVWISGENTFNAPERDVEIVEIPGRNGTLTLDNGRFKNFNITYPCYMSGDFLSDFDTFKNAILTKYGYLKLTDTYHPDGYRMARITKGIQPTPGPYNKSAKFELTFDCWPQFWLDSGRSYTTLSASGSITNPTKFPAYPLIEMSWTSGSGSATITIGGKTLTVTSPTYSPFYIDCETKRAYYLLGGNPNMPVYKDDAVSAANGEFPVINTPGSLYSYSANSNTMVVKVMPRWWQL